MSHYRQGQPGISNVPGDGAAPGNQQRSGWLNGYFNGYFGQGRHPMHQPMDPSQLQVIIDQQSHILEGMRTIYDEVRNLQQKVDGMQSANDHYKHQGADPEGNEVLRQENHDLQNQLEQVQQINQQLKHKNQEYVDILTTSPSDHVLDDEVIHRFKDLRSIVYGAVTEVWTPKLKEMIPSAKPELNSILKTLGAKDLSMLPDYRTTYSKSSLERLSSAAASHLGDLERKFANMVPKDHHEDVVQWRVATLKCSSYLKTEGTTPAHEAERSLWHKLGPITQHDTAAEDEAKKKIRQVCAAAMDLKLLMRKAENQFVVRDFRAKSMTGMADFVMTAGEELRDTGNLLGTIAFSRFGALLKYSVGENGAEPIVLERAHVVVYV
ncbi:hypothetical protein PG997_011288 [Apiospora hydei]|uniref:Uncharacterized protein n=1 Tax=Apiospora hydei TaxID=1337664 RepID=A0ABR1VIP6_9PEZI